MDSSDYDDDSDDDDNGAGGDDFNAGGDDGEDGEFEEGGKRAAGGGRAGKRLPSKPPTLKRANSGPVRPPPAAVTGLVPAAKAAAAQLPQVSMRPVASAGVTVTEETPGAGREISVPVVDTVSEAELERRKR